MSNRRLDFSSDISWLVDESGIVLFKAGKSIALPHAESTLWALLEGRQDIVTLTNMLTAILDWDEARARTWIHDRISEWLEAGYLVMEPTNG
jgi:hypothetical protein